MVSDSSVLVLPRSPPALFASSILKTIAMDGDVSRRKCAAAIFFLAICVLWSVRNDSKHSSKLPSLEKTKSIFLDRLKEGMDNFVSDSNSNQMQHPILIFFG